jgi:hypothetical protein
MSRTAPRRVGVVGDRPGSRRLATVLARRGHASEAGGGESERAHHHATGGAWAAFAGVVGGWFAHAVEPAGGSGHMSNR